MRNDVRPRHTRTVTLQVSPSVTKQLGVFPTEFDLHNAAQHVQYILRGNVTQQSADYDRKREGGLHNHSSPYRDKGMPSRLSLGIAFFGSSCRACLASFAGAVVSVACDNNLVRDPPRLLLLLLQPPTTKPIVMVGRARASRARAPIASRGLLRLDGLVRPFMSSMVQSKTQPCRRSWFIPRASGELLLLGANVSLMREGASR